MPLNRRQFLYLAAGAPSLLLGPDKVRAQVYPARPVRLLVGFPPGGTTDVVARLIGQWLSERLGQQFIIENRAGANTNLAYEALARAPADGYTLGTVGPSNVLNTTLYTHLNVDVNRDLTMVAGLNSSPLVLEVHPSVPINTVPELIAYAKANPGKLSMGSFGTGSISHMAVELFKLAAGIDVLHVPYRGSAPLVVDLLSGHVQSAIDNLPASIEQIKAGKLRALAVTTAARSEALPQIPSLGDFLPGYEAIAFLGVGAPKETPAEIVMKLNTEINAGLSDPKIQARLSQLGGAPFVLSAAAFSSFVERETEKWTKVIRDGKIKP